ncbi:MAG: ABC transporter substrate-binding protein, partial [Dehalococcoidales bacterium]|nr:ABC transporter substrate-binding protein [Dehalococcoidales bacterium]
IELKNTIASYWDSVDVLDEYTVRLNLKEYRSSILADLSDVRTCFVSPTAYREHDIDWMREHPIGTGPFKFVSWERDVYMEFTRNDNYWQPGKPYLDGIKFITIKDKNAEMTAMAAGEGDVLALQSGRELYDL